MSTRLPLGYHYNDGGINNQKFALLGLCAAAVKSETSSGREIYLPKIFSRDQHDKRSSLHDFNAVFWGDVFASFCERWGIVVVDMPDVSYADRIERGGWALFGEGAGQLGKHYHHKDDISASLAADFFRSLVPRVKSKPIFQNICNQVFFSKKIDTVAQLRIEEDWFQYCQQHLSVVVQEKEDFYLEAHRIVKKIKNSFPNVGGTIFVVCDERYIFAPKWEIAKKTYDETGVNIIWKSDLIPHEDYDALSPLEASLIDFEISALAPRFVGNSRSTFANLLCFERFTRSFRPSGDCYIYNNTEPTLGLRTDLGTAFVPKDVCAP
ncbi:O-fucosyltransferase family protein [Methylobacterium sp. J-090]|uniref:O-fucosyltransferase family protein n=1 Tax=Methylobacterium sp. J-090 TaxID=2836666 RepID=UPI001FBBF863|nr:O-fucosyltransferase family protein [Methylobacterium sp. J-090]MCJ2080678.1 O-fucosyltransferase family protein [Methylobacterium sp. J-090]